MATPVRQFDPCFGYGRPITTVRGGIKYPTPSIEVRLERHLMSTEPRMTKAQIEHELRVNSQLFDALRNRRKDLVKQLKTALPAEPLGHTMFSVDVKFKMHGKSYQFLILRNGDHYFTTGTKQDQQVFSSWETLCEWLEGPEVYSHSDIEILQGKGAVVSFDSGAIERKPSAGPAPY